MKYHPAHPVMYPYLIQSVTTIITDYDFLTIIVIAYNNNNIIIITIIWFEIQLLKYIIFIILKTVPPLISI